MVPRVSDRHVIVGNSSWNLGMIKAANIFVANTRSSGQRTLRRYQVPSLLMLDTLLLVFGVVKQWVNSTQAFERFQDFLWVSNITDYLHSQFMG